MAMSTNCQTPGAHYLTRITAGSVEVRIDLGVELDLTDEEAALLETNIHNAMEMVLARYYTKSDLKTTT
jgi:hypothetical protein